MILKVGLTGGIASGKSTVARRLGENGLTVIDADDIVRQLYAPGARGHRALVAKYGPSVLNGDDTINRAALSDLALSTPEGAAELNALIHPLVIAEQQKEFDRRAASGRDEIVVIEATLLIESGGRERFDRIVVVDVPPDIQLQRAIERGMTEEEARKRMARQLDRATRLRSADYVIENSGDRDALLRSTDALAETLRRELVRLAARS